MVPEIPWSDLSEDELQTLLQGVLDERRRRLERTRPRTFVEDIRESLNAQRRDR